MFKRARVTVKSPEEQVDEFDKKMVHRIFTSKAKMAKKIRKFGREELSNLKEVLKRGELSFVKGGMVERFEKAFGEFTGAKIAMARHSGMSGLAEAISVSGATCATEVIVDPIVHFGAIAAAYFNAVPRFADIDYDTYNMSPASLEANITERTRAVIVTHLWGLCAEMDKISQICKKRGIFLIEDCAHALCSSWKGKHAGTFGDLGVFSFQEAKHLSTGDGGMITTNDNKLARMIKKVAFSGETPHFMCINWRMNETTGAVGLAQLGKVRERVEKLYNVTLKIFNDAISDCKWLKKRFVPKDAIQSGYWFACTWEGDRYGFDYNRFKKLCERLNVCLAFGFNQAAPYEFEVFKKPTLYKHPYCPTLCPFYTKVSNYRYKTGLCPTAEELIPRLVTMSLIFVSVEEAKRRAELLRNVIKETEK